MTKECAAALKSQFHQHVTNLKAQAGVAAAKGSFPKEKGLYTLSEHWQVPVCGHRQKPA
jgi:hypothetical protein